MNVEEIKAVVTRVLGGSRVKFDATKQTPKEGVGEPQEIVYADVENKGRLIGDALFREYMPNAENIVRTHEQVRVSGNKHYYSSTLTSNDVKVNFAVQFQLEEEQLTAYLPQFVLPLEEAINALQGLEFDFLEKMPSKELPIVVVPKNKNVEVFTKLISAEDRQKFLATLAVDDLYQLAMDNFHCAIMVLNSDGEKLAKFSFEQRAEIKRNIYNNLLPALTDELIENVGHLSESNEQALTEFADEILPSVIKNPHEVQLLNADALFLLSWKKPVYFKLLDATAVLRHKEENNSLVSELSERYDALLDSYRQTKQSDANLNNRLGEFSEYMVGAVNKNDVALETALTSRVIERSAIRVGSASIKLSARLVADALSRKSGVKELVGLLENEPRVLQSALNKTDEVMLSTYMLNDHNLVKQLSPKAIKTLLQYDQGSATKIPTFLDALPMRFRLDANPMKTLTVEELLDVAVAAKNNQNLDQVNAIIKRCATEPSRWERFKLWMAGQPNHYQQLLDSPVAISQFYKVASKEQIEQFVEQSETKRNALFAGVVHAQAKTEGVDVAYLDELNKDKIDLLRQLQSRDKSVAADDPLKKMLSDRVNLESSQDDSLKGQLEAPRLIEELELGGQAIYEKMRVPTQWERLLELVSDKQILEIRLIEVLKNKREIANLFVENIDGLFNSLAMTSSTIHQSTRILLGEMIQTIIKNHANLAKNLMLHLSTRVIYDRQNAAQISQILESEQDSVISTGLINAAYTNAHDAKDAMKLQKTSEFFKVLKFLVNYEIAHPQVEFASNYIKSHQDNIGNLIKITASRWLASAAEMVKAIPNTSVEILPAIKAYRKLYGDEDADKLLDDIVSQNIGFCILIYDYDVNRRVTWLYDQPHFWLGLFANEARFDAYFNGNNFGANDALRIGFMTALPELLENPLNESQENKTVQIIQALINVNKTNNSLMVKVINDIRSSENFERVESILKKIFANPNVLSILVHNKELGDVLGKTSSLWKAFPNSRLLLEEFIRGQFSHIEITAENSVDVEEMINGITDKKLLELVRTNADQLGLEYEENEWVFVELKIPRKIASDVSPSQAEVPAAMKSGHREEEGGEGEGAKKGHISKFQH